MSATPDDRFPLPESFGPGSVWADRVGHRSLIGRTQKGIEIPIGAGEGEVSPGELLKLALIGCAGMTSDHALSRRLGEDYDIRLWAHGVSDEADDRYHVVPEEIQLDLDALDEKTLRSIGGVLSRAIAAGCTIERSVVPGIEVTHTVLGLDEALAAGGVAGDASDDAGEQEETR